MTSIAAHVATQVTSARILWRAAAVIGVMAMSLAFGWALVERGPMVAFLPFALGVAVALAFAALSRPLYAVLVLAGVVSAYPIARVVVGAVPIYLTDVLVALALIAAWLRGIPRGRLQFALGLYLLSWVPAWIYEVVRTGLLLEPTYGLVRNVLAVTVAIPVVAAIRSRRAVELFLLVFAACTILTSALAVAQVTPGLRVPMRELLSSLAPSFVPAGYEIYPERAFALFTAPTALSGYLAVSLPVFIAGRSSVNKNVRRVLILATAAAVLALIATYSRQWAPALAVGVLVLVIARPQVLARTTLTVAASAVLVVVALSASVLDSGYLTERFSRLGTGDRNVQTRVVGQGDFLAITRAEGASTDTLLGRGFAGQDIVARNLTDTSTAEALRRGVSENSLLLEFFNHGLLAGLLYIGILLAVVRSVIVAMRRPSSFNTLLGGLLASLATVVTLHFLDRYFSEAVFMKMLLWILVGFSLAVVRLARSEAPPLADHIPEPTH